jgi:catechol 2,3-dioxygenase-like lactoylglutathione lyase family enzyme
MLHHVSIGVMNVERAARFYDGVLAALGYRRVMEFMPYGIGYGADTPAFWVQLPHNQSPATMGNGVHVAFVAASKDMIGAFHRAALEAGGVDEGPPGPRPDYGPDYYGAFVRDLDGNKIEAAYWDAELAAKLGM